RDVRQVETKGTDAELLFDLQPPAALRISFRELAWLDCLANRAKQNQKREPKPQCKLKTALRAEKQSLSALADTLKAAIRANGSKEQRWRSAESKRAGNTRRKRATSSSARRFMA